MSTEVLLVHTILAFIVLVISLSLGRLLLQYKSEYQPIASLFKAEKSVGFNAILRICLTPVCIVLFAIIAYSINRDSLVHNIWHVALIYALLQCLVFTVLSRWKLVNISKFVLFHLLSIALTYYIYAALISKGLQHLLPDEANLRTDLWILIAGFLFSIFYSIPENDQRFQARKNNYATSRAAKFKAKYHDELKSQEPLFQDILVAIMIFEDFNRPWFARVVERLINAKTQGIMQTTGAKTDEHSIKRAIKKLLPEYIQLSELEDNSSEKYSAIYGLVKSYKPYDPDYAHEVMGILGSFRDISVDYRSSLTAYQPLG